MSSTLSRYQNSGEQLNKERENVFISYFKKREVEKKVKISTAESFFNFSAALILLFK
jgi:hypothetical protein